MTSLESMFQIEEYPILHCIYDKFIVEHCGGINPLTGKVFREEALKYDRMTSMTNFLILIVIDYFKNNDEDYDRYKIRMSLTGKYLSNGDEIDDYNYFSSVYIKNKISIQPIFQRDISFQNALAFSMADFDDILVQATSLIAANKPEAMVKMPTYNDIYDMYTGVFTGMSLTPIALSKHINNFCKTVFSDMDVNFVKDYIIGRPYQKMAIDGFLEKIKTVKITNDSNKGIIRNIKFYLLTMEG